MNKRKLIHENKENIDLKKVKTNTIIPSGCDFKKPNDLSEMKAHSKNTKHTHDDACNPFVPSSSSYSAMKSECINSLIKDINFLGEYCVHGEARELPCLPGLHIRDFGIVSLPLMKKDIRQLKEIHSNDQNDSAVLKIDKSLIEIKNPQWNEKLNQLVDSIGAEMGCKGKIEAKLSELILHERKSVTSKMKDDSQNKFANLRIQLPSNFVGGDLITYHAKESRSFDFGQSRDNTAYSIYYAAYYSDLKYELLELNKGYRLELIYSLCWSKANSHGENIFRRYDLKEYNFLIDQFAAILGKSSQDKRLFLFLDDNYDQQEVDRFEIENLKGVDKQRFKLIKMANEKLGKDNQLEFYLVHANLIIECPSKVVYTVYSASNFYELARVNLGLNNEFEAILRALKTIPIQMKASSS